MNVNHRVFARLMQARGYEGGDIRLITCFSGESGAAQNVANRFGVNVQAPKVGSAWVHPNGAVTSGNGPFVNHGFPTFTPGKK